MELLIVLGKGILSFIIVHAIVDIIAMMFESISQKKNIICIMKWLFNDKGYIRVSCAIASIFASLYTIVNLYNIF